MLGQSSVQRDVTYLFLVSCIEYFWATSHLQSVKTLGFSSSFSFEKDHPIEIWILKNPILCNGKVLPFVCGLERDAGPNYVNFDHRSS